MGYVKRATKREGKRSARRDYIDESKAPEYLRGRIKRINERYTSAKERWGALYKEYRNADFQVSLHKGRVNQAIRKVRRSEDELYRASVYKETKKHLGDYEKIRGGVVKDIPFYPHHRHNDFEYVRAVRGNNLEVVRNARQEARRLRQERADIGRIIGPAHKKIRRSFARIDPDHNKQVRLDTIAEKKQYKYYGAAYQKQRQYLIDEEKRRWAEAHDRVRRGVSKGAVIQGVQHI